MNDTNNANSESQFPAPPAPPAPQPPQAATQAVNWERATLEKLATNYLTEQKTARRWRTFVRLAWLAFFALLAWSALDRGNASKDMSADHTKSAKNANQASRTNVRQRRAVFCSVK